MIAWHYFYLWLRSIALAALGVLSGYFLTLKFGAPVGLAIAAGAVLVATLIGVLLLRTSTTGELTWKNRAASVFMPWGYRLSDGTLARLGMASGAIWMLQALAGAAVALSPASGSAAGSALSWSVVAFWFVNGIAATYVLGSLLSQHSSSNARAAMSLLPILLVLVGVVALSVTLLLVGWPIASLVVAAAPAIIVGVPYGGFVIVMLTVGRNARWN